MRSCSNIGSWRSLDRHQGVGLLCAMGAMLAMTLISLDPGAFGTLGGSIAVSLAFTSIVALATRPIGKSRAAVAGRVVPATESSTRRAA